MPSLLELQRSAIEALKELDTDTDLTQLDSADPDSIIESVLAANIFRRQSSASGLASIPGCITGCMGVANIGDCKSLQDTRCLCNSTVYQKSVTQCWAIRCNATSYDMAVSFSSATCAVLGGGASPGDNGASANTAMPPVVFARSVFNIQAVMSAVCALILAGAIALGVLSCRNQARKEAMIGATGAWSTNTNGKSKAKGASRVPASYYPGGSEIATVDLGGSVDFTEMFTPPQRTRSTREPGAGPRFTNRLPGATGPRFTNRLSPQDEEEWEMSPTNASDRDRRTSTSSTKDGLSVHFSLHSKEGFSPESVDSHTRHGEVSVTPSFSTSTAHLNPTSPSTLYMTGEGSSGSGSSSSIANAAMPTISASPSTPRINTTAPAEPTFPPAAVTKSASPHRQGSHHAL